MECVVSGIAVTPSEFEAPGADFGLFGQREGASRARPCA